MLNFFKKNQIIIYVIAFMLVTAGYLNYTSNNDMQSLLSNADPEQISENTNIGDAQLVNSNDVIIEDESFDEENVGTMNTESTQSTQVNAGVGNSNSNSSYYEESKLQRDTMYSQTLETYKEMLDNSNVSEEQKAIITQEITNLSKEKNAIMVCENLITTKGFSNCVIFVNTDSISVVIESDELKTDEIAQIQNIISREMGAEVEDIHIMTKN